MYVAVKGGEKAIDNAHAWLAEERRGDPDVPELGVAQIREQMTLAVGARQYLYEQRYLWGDFAAAAILSGLPITVLFLICQRFLVSGLAEGGVKG